MGSLIVRHNDCDLSCCGDVQIKDALYIYRSLDLHSTRNIYHIYAENSDDSIYHELNLTVNGSYMNVLGRE